ncbi:Class I myosin tail homology domain [Dillenia turbinata]|uniref:Class I myosin tail homology domain n=1 Tax=Dillenia turbinata TaxID=194707 RepID=A0AAN8ZDL2_9MAGN
MVVANKMGQAESVMGGDELGSGMAVGLGDKQVLFADRVLKFTSTGKIKSRILVITEFAFYIVDPETDSLKRRISLAAVEKLCLKYDLLLATTRKTEIVTVFVETTKNAPDYEIDVLFANSFEYNASAELVKEIQFEQVEGLYSFHSEEL